MRIRTLHRQQRIPAPLPKVFAFFSEARNLGDLTPPWLNFQFGDQTDVELRPGTLIHYALSWHGLAIKWTTRIEDWHPPTSFIDVQLKGPYGMWRHTHSFTEFERGTLMRDEVEYALPLGWIGDLAAGWRVRRDVERIFDYRAEQIAAIFGR